MGTRRKFTPEYRGEAVAFVTDSGRAVSDVARSLGIRENASPSKLLNLAPESLDGLYTSWGMEGLNDRRASSGRRSIAGSAVTAPVLVDSRIRAGERLLIWVDRHGRQAVPRHVTAAASSAMAAQSLRVALCRQATTPLSVADSTGPGLTDGLWPGQLCRVFAGHVQLIAATCGEGHIRHESRDQHCERQTDRSDSPPAESISAGHANHKVAAS